MDSLLRKVSGNEHSQPKRGATGPGLRPSTLKMLTPPSDPGAGCEPVRVNVFPAGLSSCFGSNPPCYFSPFWNGNVYSGVIVC
jgi:hypothetical protein